jgi:hypothetical protein
MSISQNFPAISPTLNLNFARSKKLDPRITFTRTSSATRTNAQGLIETVSANVPRFDHSYNSSTGSVNSLGLLVEESRTNLTTYSEQFDNAAWSKFNVGVTTNTSSTTAPDGTTNSELMTRTTTSAAYFLKGHTKAASSITYTASAFVKKSVGNYCALTAQGTYPSRAAVVFDINSGTISRAATAYSSFTNASASITSYPNGWYRISLTATSDTATTYDTYFNFNSNGVEIDVTDSASNSAGFIWGAQLEAGAFPTSYIPTVASTVTRSADNASMTGTNFSSWYNSTEGTLFASIRNQTVRSSITYDRFIALCGSDVNLDEISIYTQTASGGGAQNKFNFSIVSGGTPSADFNVAGPDNIGKAILAYKTNDAAGTVNGITPGTDTSVTLPTCTNLQICGTVRFQQKPTATISQLLYYPRRLTNTQLQNLTK